MKVLVDSCIWSLALRRRKGAESLNPNERKLVESLSEAIRDGRVAIIGPVRQEVLSGIKHEKQFEQVREMLVAFADFPIESADYIDAARLDNLCRRRGAQCGEVDMLLCAVAARNGWKILTSDAALLRCIEIIGLELPASDPAPRAKKHPRADMPDRQTSG
ncbi:MAG TPA: PIN domain-containing protein [Bryobacteraceae bacterium]|nr:PIN domain-containing protein [Bryobacteraceae bacterium]